MNNRTVELNELMPFIKECLDSSGQCVIYPKGTSMLPMLRQGSDSVTLSKAPEKLKKYDIPLYQRENGEYILHRVVKVSETYSCVGDNQFDVEKNISHSAVIAVVTAFSRTDKSYSVDSFGYKLYCRFWNYIRPLRFLLWKLALLIKHK